MITIQFYHVSSFYVPINLNTDCRRASSLCAMHLCVIVHWKMSIRWSGTKKIRKCFFSTLPYIQRLYRFVLSLVGNSAVDYRRLHVSTDASLRRMFLYKHAFNMVPWEIFSPTANTNKASPTLRLWQNKHKYGMCDVRSAMCDGH